MECSYDDRNRDFLGGPEAETPGFQVRGLSAIPDQATRSHMPQLKDPESHSDAERVGVPELRPSLSNR